MRRLKRGARKIKHALGGKKIFENVAAVLSKRSVVKIKKQLSEECAHFKRSKKDRKRALIAATFAVVVFGAGALFFQQKYVLPIYDKIELPKAPEIIFYPDAKVSFGVISDIHALAKGSSGRYVFSPKYKFTAEEFAETMRDDFKPDFMVANGDVIDGTYQEPEEGIAVLGMVKNVFDTAKVPTYWTIGNHELRSLTREQWKQALGLDYLDKAFEIDKYKVIIVDNQFGAGVKAEDDDNAVRGKLLSDEQKKWLENELSTTRKIPVVFMHSPPFYMIDGKFCGGSIEEADYLQKLFSRYHVAAVFSGHIEKLSHQEIDGVDYYVIPGLQKSGTYFGTFAEVNMIRRRAEVNLFYRDAADNEKIERVE